MELTQAYLKECLDYDPLTGIFTWKYRPSCSKHRNTRFTGKVAGYTGARPYNGSVITQIRLDGKLHAAARLAWFYVTGTWPVGELDHINHDSTDNRFANLRDVSHKENMKNVSKRRTNTSGATGVSWIERSKKWRASIGTKSRRFIYGGQFDTFDEAVAKRKELEAKYNFHANHGAEKRQPLSASVSVENELTA